MMAESTKLEVEGACAGLETPGGQIFPVKDHVADVPRGHAQRFLDSGAPNVSRHRSVGIGWTRKGEEVWDRIFGSEAKGGNDGAELSNAG